MIRNRMLCAAAKTMGCTAFSSSALHPQEEGWSEEASFVTPPPTGLESSISLLAIADMGQAEVQGNVCSSCPKNCCQSFTWTPVGPQSSVSLMAIADMSQAEARLAITK